MPQCALYFTSAAVVLAFPFADVFVVVFFAVVWATVEEGIVPTRAVPRKSTAKPIVMRFIVSPYFRKSPLPGDFLLSCVVANLPSRASPSAWVAREQPHHP